MRLGAVVRVDVERVGGIQAESAGSSNTRVRHRKAEQGSPAAEICRKLGGGGADELATRPGGCWWGATCRSSSPAARTRSIARRWRSHCRTATSSLTTTTTTGHRRGRQTASCGTPGPRARLTQDSRRARPDAAPFVPDEARGDGTLRSSFAVLLPAGQVANQLPIVVIRSRGTRSLHQVILGPLQPSALVDCPVVCI